MIDRQRLWQRAFMLGAMCCVAGGCGSPLDSKCWLRHEQGGYLQAERVGSSSIGLGADGSYVLAVGTRCGFMCSGGNNADPCVDCEGNNVGRCGVSKDHAGNPILVPADERDAASGGSA